MRIEENLWQLIKIYGMLEQATEGCASVSLLEILRDRRVSAGGRPQRWKRVVRRIIMNRSQYPSVQSSAYPVSLMSSPACSRQVHTWRSRGPEEAGGHKNVEPFCKCLGISTKSLTIFQVFSDLLKSNCGLPLRTFSSKCFMLVYFKKNIGLAFLGPFTFSSLHGFVSLFSVQDVLWDSKEVASRLKSYV